MSSPMQSLTENLIDLLRYKQRLWFVTEDADNASEIGDWLYMTITSSFRILVVLGMSLSILASTGCADEGTESDRERHAMNEPHVTKSSKVNDVVLELSLPDDAVAGKSLEMTVTLTNTGKEQVTWGEINGYRELGIRVLDARKQPAPLTEFGRGATGRSVVDDTELADIFRNILRKLPPGASRVWHVDLNKLFQLKPGEYQVSVSIEVNGSMNGFKVAVDDIALSVNPGP